MLLVGAFRSVLKVVRVAAGMRCAAVRAVAATAAGVGTGVLRLHASIKFSLLSKALPLSRAKGD